MPDEFLTTRWSLVLTARGEGPAAGAALEQLCRGVWRPLYAFARRWGCTPEDAEDAVQGFMASLLARRSINGTVEGKGRFRSFLLAGMRNHMSDEHSRKTAAKRGGGAAVISLDAGSAERGFTDMAVDQETPERAFERVWAMEVMAGSRAKLAEECAASGKGEIFAALFTEPGGEPASFAAIGERLGMTETALRSAAMRLRRRWRDLIRAELAQTVGSSEALEEELAALRAALT